MLFPEDWLKEVHKSSPSLWMDLERIYGNYPQLIQERRSALGECVSQFGKTFGQKKRFQISRAPARVNLMGRHIDHQGGFINTIAINKEILFAFSPREDSKIQIHNMDSDQFPSHLLSPKSLLDISSYSDWTNFATSAEVKELNKQNPSDWSLYILAIIYRFQLRFKEFDFKGLDCLVSGNIPVGSGLSSSSALGVAFAKALIQVNQIQISDQLLIELTGESELFLGFLGGMGDQAAIISAKKGMVSKIGFFPFHEANAYRFPEGLKIIIAFSGFSAKKGGTVQGTYNQRVASYAIGFKMLQHIWEPAESVNHIRDLIPNQLNKSSAEILTALTKLPVSPTRNDIKEFFGNKEHAFLNRFFQTHEDPGEYDLIGTLLFGICECARSESFNDILESGQDENIQSIIAASHNGDRINGHDSQMIKQAINQNLSMMDISGNYGTSTKNIDQMVDIANEVPGTIGAQLAGAGMGGNIVVLVKNEVTENVMKALKEKYYEPKNIPFDAHICVPISGASIIGESNK